MVRRTIRIFVWILAAVVILAAGLLAYLRNADLSVYQGRVESFLSSKIGHELQIDGRFELHFGRTTTLIAEDVSLRNPAWAPDPELLEVDHLTIAFNTWSVLSGPFILEELAVDQIRLLVDRTAQGALNWAAEETVADDSEPVEFDANRIVFRTVKIEGLEVIYRDGRRTRPVHATIDSLTVTPDANDILDLDLQGVVNDLQLWADGKLGPWQNFVVGRDIVADLDMTLGQLRLSVDGTVADLVSMQGVELNAVLAGSDIAPILERLALPPFATGEFELVANVQQVGAAQQIRLDGNLGDIELFASGNMDSLRNPQTVAHDISIAGPDAQSVAELFGIDGLAPLPFQISGDYSRAGRVVAFHNAILRVGENSVSLDSEVDFSSPDTDWDLRVSAAGPNFSVVGPLLKLRGLPAKAFTIEGRVSKNDSTWLAENVDVAVGENRVTGNGQIETGSHGTSEINVRATGPDIAFVQDFTGIQGIPSQPYDITATIRPHPLGVRIDTGLGVFGDNRIAADGVIALRPGLDGTILAMEASGPELTNLKLLTRVPHLPAGAFAISANVEIDGERILLRDVEAAVNELRGMAAGHVVVMGDAMGEFGLDVSLSGPDVNLLFETELLQDFAGDPFQVQGEVTYEAGRVSTNGLDVALGSLSAELRGYLVAATKQLDVSVTARAEESNDFRKLANLRYLPDGNAFLDAKIEKTETTIKFTDSAFRVGEFEITAHGALDLTPLSNDSDLAVAASGPNLMEAGRIVGARFLPEKKFSVSGQFRGTPGGFAVQNLLAKVGDSDLHGDFSADLNNKPRIVGSLVSTRLDVTDGLQLPDDAAKSQKTGGIDKPKRFFPDKELDSSWLQKADIDVEIAIDKFVANTLRVEDVRIGINVQDGVLNVEPIQLREGLGSVTGVFHLAPDSESYSMRASLSVDNVHTGLRVSADQELSTLPPLTGRFQLSGTGDSVRAIMASSNGTLSFGQGSGKVREVLGSALFRDVFLEVARALNPARRSREYQILECSIFEITIVDGQAKIDEFAIQTDTMMTLARGNIDLGTEKLDIAFSIKPRKGVGVSIGTVANQLLEVRGTLRAPKIVVDVGKTAATTGAAVATGGLSLLARGLWNRLSAETSICEKKSKKP